VNDADDVNAIHAFTIEDEIAGDWEESQAGREIGPRLSSARMAGESPAFRFDPVGESHGCERIANSNVADDLIEIVVGVGGEPKMCHVSGAGSLARPQSCEDFVRFDQFAAIGLIEAVLDFANQFLPPQSANIFALADPLRERESITRGKFGRFGFELFDGHGGRIPLSFRPTNSKSLPGGVVAVRILCASALKIPAHPLILRLTIVPPFR
jgi:hypothetical protein